MAMFDDNLLSGEDLVNIDNDNEGNNDINKSSSDNEVIKKILKIVKKRQMSSMGESTCEWSYRKHLWKWKFLKKNSSSQIRSHRKTKRCTIKLLRN